MFYDSGRAFPKMRRCPVVDLYGIVQGKFLGTEMNAFGSV